VYYEVISLNLTGAENSQMATTSSGGEKPTTTRRTASTRKSAGTNARSGTGRTRSTTRTRSTRATTASTQAHARTRVGQVQEIAERAVLVPVGASLLARDNFVSTVKGIATKYRTRANLEREIKRYERRGASARNRFERQVRRTRTKFERELRQRRNRLEKGVKQSSRRVEREVRSVRRDLAKQPLGAQVEKLVANAQELISS
jgi:hypothetical protein